MPYRPTFYLNYSRPKYSCFILSINYFTLVYSTMDTVQPPQPAPVNLLPTAPELRANSVTTSINFEEHLYVFLQDAWLSFMSFPKMSPKYSNSIYLLNCHPRLNCRCSWIGQLCRLRNRRGMQHCTKSTFDLSPTPLRNSESISKGGLAAQKYFTVIFANILLEQDTVRQSVTYLEEAIGNVIVSL